MNTQAPERNSLLHAVDEPADPTYRTLAADPNDSDGTDGDEGDGTDGTDGTDSDGTDGTDSDGTDGTDNGSR
jgi:hypothetical protein